MYEDGSATPSDHYNNKISQAEFYSLYLQSLDDRTYRPIIDGEVHFYLAKLLMDRGFSPDLSDLNLRNLDFIRADFTGINLKFADLRGSLCDYADFRGATNIHIMMDTTTRLYGAKLTQGQLLELQIKPSPLSSSLDDEFDMEVAPG